MGKQEAVVTFAPGTSQATMLKVRAACAKIPGATRRPIPTDAQRDQRRLLDVRFRVDQAPHADIARLSKCLSQFKSSPGRQLEQQDGS